MTTTNSTKNGSTTTSSNSSRTDYAQLLETQLTEWKKEFASLRDQAKKVAGKVTGDASHDVQATLDALKEREQTVEKKIAELKAASDEAWDTMKVGLEVAWVDLKGAGKEAVAKFTHMSEQKTSLQSAPRAALRRRKRLFRGSISAHVTRVIELDGVEQTFRGQGGLRRTSLVVADGERLALVGASGSGKSTLLRLVVGLVSPERGEVRIDGARMDAASAVGLRRRIGYAIQDGGLFPHLSAGDNVVLVARHVGWSMERTKARLAELAALVRLRDPLLARYPSELSGGQRQRVGLMRALCLDPAILLFDEPLAALDPVVRVELQEDLLAILEGAKKTVVLVTHDLAEAAYLSPEIAVLHDGAIVQRGSLAELRSAPADPIVTALLTAARGLAS